MSRVQHHQQSSEVKLCGVWGAHERTSCGFGEKPTSLSFSFICKMGIIVNNDGNYFTGVTWKLNELMDVKHLLRTMPNT